LVVCRHYSPLTGHEKRSQGALDVKKTFKEKKGFREHQGDFSNAGGKKMRITKQRVPLCCFTTQRNQGEKTKTKNTGIKVEVHTKGGPGPQETSRSSGERGNRRSAGRWGTLFLGLWNQGR